MLGGRHTPYLSGLSILCFVDGIKIRPPPSLQQGRGGGGGGEGRTGGGVGERVGRVVNGVGGRKSGRWAGYGDF